MKLNSVAAVFTQQRNLEVLVMKPKRIVHEFSREACDTCPKYTVPLFEWLTASSVFAHWQSNK